MNIRKIKLALSVGLLNNQNQNLLQVIKKTMDKHREDVGHLLNTNVIDSRSIDDRHIEKDYMMYFENCALKINTIINKHNTQQYIQNFNLYN